MFPSFGRNNALTLQEYLDYGLPATTAMSRNEVEPRVLRVGTRVEW